MPSPNRNILMFFKKEDIPLAILGTILMCFSAVSTPLSTMIYGDTIGCLGEFYTGQLNYHEFITKVRILCGALMGIGAAKMILVWFGISVWMRFGEVQQLRARKQLFNKLLHEEIKWYDRKQNLMGNISQVNRCIEELRGGNAEVMAMLVQTFALIIALVIMSFYQSWAITLVILASAPVMAFSGWWFGRLTYKAAEVENETTAEGSKVLDWCLVSPEIVRVFNGKYVEFSKFKAIVNSSAKAYYKLANAISANTAVLKFLTLMMFVQAFWFGIYLMSKGTITINQLITCFGSCLMLGSTVSGVTELLAVLNTAHAAAGKISTFLDMKDKDKDKFDFRENLNIYPSTCNGNISFNHVYFQYPSRDELILKDITFTLEPNTMNFIIGKSGSGKSTIPLLLMNIYDVQCGSIEIDSHPIQLLDPKYITQNLTLVQQNPTIFNKSIRENIALGVSDFFHQLEHVPEHLISDAAEFSLLHDLIEDKGLDVQVSSSSLSGGQQQRIAIARAKLRDPPILILDEAFSALDFKNRNLLFDKIRQWRTGKTTIVITHEFNNIESEDYVILTEGGKVVSEGPFRVLQDEHFIQAYNFDETEVESQETLTPDYKELPKSIYYNYKTSPYILKDLENQKVKEEEKENIMGVFAILKYCSKSIETKWVIVVGIIISILNGATNPIFSSCFAQLLSSSIDASMGIGVNEELLKWSCISIGVAFFIGLSGYVSQFILAYASERWIVSLRKTLFERINGQDMSFFDSEVVKPAEITALLMNDTRDLRNLISEFLQLIVNLITMVLVGLIWAIVVGWKLSLVGIAFVPLVLILTGFYGLVLNSTENDYKSSIAKLENNLYQVVSTIKTIRIYNMLRYFSNSFDNRVHEVQNVGIGRAIKTGIGLAVNDLLASVATATVLYFGMTLAGRSEYTSNQFMQVVSLLTFTLTNASSLLSQLPEISRGQRAGTLIVKLLENSALSKVENNGILKPTVVPDNIITFDHIEFAYPFKKQRILCDFSCEIQKNELIGIVGESGAGKSTIVSLLTRLYGTHSNQVKFFDEDIASVDIDWLRYTIGLVPQFPKFFEGTIYENLTYGMSPSVQISYPLLEEVLKMVGIYDFVVTLPEGLQTQIGEGSNSLVSGGQLQRLSIARALIRRPKVLIFDECTSNLDPLNSQHIIELIKKQLAGNYTIIIITHDKEMMKITDRLIVLKGGRVCESGKYNQLLATNGELTRITRSSI
ncbi:ATP-dependent permease [Spathaspora passalidarum NRRL Y-27907]|uniref:ATP-dependent permease n=1 Tax=Spathaspora passalidarum (strain NRRL Y-27907 / 11-Y1) TaxID=619300 RepID=G3ARK8_SPAPN|nr:ATP-dependent permease [Spathaspora passalidarum NRRL Y-27907]EGW31761.1 ATP-dependent permease [Spathaspora passalidarum NRRL Y-27907]